jgi:PAS domain S-box-containing protein
MPDRRRLDDTLTTLDQFSELFVVLDQDWRIMRLNRAACLYLTRLGLDPDQMPGRVIWNEVPELMGTALFRGAERAVRDQRPVEIETYFAPLERWFAARFLPSPPGLRCFLRDVTAEREARQAARSSAGLVQTVIDSTDDIICAKDLAGRYIMANRALVTLVGRDVIGLTDRDYLPADIADQIASNDQLVLSRDETLVFEEPGVAPDGGRLVFETSKSVLRDSRGQPTGILGISRDITQAQRERRRRELLYEAGTRLTASLELDATLGIATGLVVPEIADVVMVDLCTATGGVQRARVTFADRRIEREFGDRLRAIVPRTEWRDHPGAVALRTGESVALYTLDADGLERFAQTDEHRSVLVALALRSMIAVPFVAHGQVLGVMTVGYGASGRRYAPDDVPLLRALADRMALAIANARLFRAVQEELARRTEAQVELARWGKIFEHAGWGVAIGDPETGRYLRVNPTYARLHGYEADELVGMPIWELTVPAWRDFARAETQRAIETGRAAYASRHLRRNGGEFPVRVDLTAISDGRGVMLAANLQDDTERETAEERVREAQKMEALGRLAGGVAHDFNNMLMIIMGFADFLVAAMDEEDVRRRDAEEIRKASERAAALTQQLMVFGRQVPVTASNVHLNDVILSLGDMLRSVLGETVVLRMELDPVPSGIRVDRGHLEQALLNLVLNAKDAMPNGGALTLRTRGLRVDRDPPAGSEELRSGDYVVIEISDTGHGMDESTQARIFEPFFTTRAGRRNSGLGLAVVYGMVTQNHGRIWVTSAPDAGSTFTLCFPRAELPETEAVAAADAAPSGHEVALVVEDEAAVRQLVKRALTEAGYRVLSARDADEARRVLARPGAIHVLVADLVLPGTTSGAALAQEAVAARPDLAVLFMSGHATEAEDMGDEAVRLTKPFAPGDLVRKVREAIDRRLDG